MEEASADGEAPKRKTAERPRRKAPFPALCRLLAAALVFGTVFQLWGAGAFWLRSSNEMSRVVIVSDPRALNDFQPAPEIVQRMVNRGVMLLTGRTNVSSAWLSLVSTNDVIGLKVFSAAGPVSGTRPAVVRAVIRGLTAAGVPPDHIIIWDKRAEDLRAAGFFQLGRELGVRVAGCVETGYDPTNFYLPDNPLVGRLVWGDLEFGKKGPGVGRKSFVAKIVSHEMTKLISLAPLLNNNQIGVCGHLYSVALGSVDNTTRFEDDPDQLAVAVPEIYALPSVGDKVVLNITDALLGQYEGGDKGLLQYSEVLDQLWFSRDPVALDTLAVAELARARRERAAPEFKVHTKVYSNAHLLQLGEDDPARIRVERIP